MSEEEKPKLGWGGARPNSGRKPGQTDPRPKEIREMLLQAAADSDYGRDPEHPDEPGSALRFFTSLANRNLDNFVQLLLKTIPRQVNSSVESTIGIEIHRSLSDVRRDMEMQGFSQRQIDMIQNILPGPINGNDK
jgi:hypothetical protein